jgi:hypothetical protein
MSAACFLGHQHDLTVEASAVHPDGVQHEAFADGAPLDGF